MAQGVPIRGEAGMGYVLGEGFDMPPLMFTAEELEALMLGLRWVIASVMTNCSAPRVIPSPRSARCCRRA